MRKIISFLFVLSLSCSYLFADNIYWVGTTGPVTTSTNWNTQSNGSGVSRLPTATDDVIISQNGILRWNSGLSVASIRITNGAQVVFENVGSSTSIDLVGGSATPAFWVESGTSLLFNGTKALTVLLKTGLQAEIAGTLDFLGTGSKMDFVTGSITTVKNGGKIRYGGASGNPTSTVSSLVMETGAMYEIYKNASSFPPGTYASGSTILNSGALTTPAGFAMGASTGSYGNYVFNSPLFTGTTAAINNSVIVNDFSILSTGTSGKWILSNSSTSAYTFFVNGNMEIDSNAILDINNAASGTQSTTIQISGNITNNGLITESGGNSGSILEFVGTQPATFFSSSTGFSNDISVKINRNQTIVALSDIFLPATANARFFLSNGCIDMKTNDHVLWIQNPSVNAVLLGSVSSHVIGKLKRSANQVGNYYYPVSNDAIQFAKILLTTNSSTLTDWTVEFYGDNPLNTQGLTPGLIEVVSNYYWNVEASSPSASLARLVFYYDGLQNPNIIDPTQIKVVRWNAALPVWENLGGLDLLGSLQNAFGTLGGASPADPISNFGIFSFGGLLNVLPIKLEYFTGANAAKRNILNWKLTCSETEGVQMELERGNDGRKFNTIYSLYADAQRCLQSFQYVDVAPLPGKNFYRLKMTDLDGKISYSSTVSLNGSIHGISSLSIYPNPANENTRIRLISQGNVKGRMLILDNQGKLIRETAIQVRDGINEWPLFVGNLSAGQYRLVLMEENGQQQTSVILKQ